tara:strand:- start:2117 stop:2434 length:318 start_codon:yes stop_codon:yes gene_type:complete
MIKNLNILIFISLISTCVFPNRVVSGTVIDCKTNLPIPGAEIIISKSQLNQKPKLTDFDGYFELDISDTTKEIFIRYPKYKELKIAISENNNLGEITLLKRGCKK